MTKDEALDLALRSLKELVPDESDYAPAIQGQRKRQEKAITAIKQALAQPVQSLPFGVGGGLVAIKTLLSRDPCVHANTAIEMLDAILKEHPAAQPAPVQEPVATLWQHGETGRTRITMPGDITDCDARWFKAADLYTTPPAAQPAPVQEPVGWFKYDKVSGCWHPQHDEFAPTHAVREGWKQLYTTPPVQPAPVQEPAFKVGNLVTLTGGDYPGLGQWFVQLWDGDEVAARVYGDDREAINRRIAALNTPPAAQPAVPLTDEQKRDLIKKSALWDMHIHIGWYSAPAKSFVEKTIQLIADIEAAHGITKGQP